MIFRKSKGLCHEYKICSFFSLVEITDNQLIARTNINILVCILIHGARGSVVVKALSYKPEGCGLGTRRGEFLNLRGIALLLLYFTKLQGITPYKRFKERKADR
jgi:hypothetical protein